MNKYQHLTAAQRGVIQGLLLKYCTLTEIAGKLGVSLSTVSREINKRKTPNGYFAHIAQLNYQERRMSSKQKKKMDFSLRQKYVCKKLQLGWSPEQISGRLKLEGDYLYVCPETIYRFLYGDSWAKEEKFYQYLRLGRKKRKKHTGRSVHCSKIPNRTSIHDRPAIVDQREEVGHWEGDSVIYPYKMAINTLNELYAGIVRFTKLDRKTAKLTAIAMGRRLQENIAKTLTLDNGSEFMDHEDITRQTMVRIFFADAYCSCQRGSNENSNGLLRGYLPKRCDIRNLTQEELDDIAEELNNRPRKRLGFKTPNEVYYHYLQNLLKKGTNIALDCRM
jgi:transposase, IS30 family